MPEFSVNQDACRKDGICARVCPVHLIKDGVENFPSMRRFLKNACIACGQCVAFCPHGACSIDVLPQEETAPVRRELLPTPEQAEMLFRSRRSIRQYKQTPVPKELLLRVLDTARYAPSAKNRQPVRWLVMYERARIQALGDILADWFAGADDDDENSAEAHGLAAAWRRGEDPLFRGAPHLVFAVAPVSWAFGIVDSAIALTYLELAAYAHGLGCCWAGYLTRGCAAHAPLREALGIGDDEVIAGAQMIGYPMLRPTRIPPRKPLDVQWLE